MASLPKGENTDISHLEPGRGKYHLLPTKTKGMRNVGGLRSGSHHKMPKLIETETVAEKFARLRRPENAE